MGPSLLIVLALELTRIGGTDGVATLGSDLEAVEAGGFVLPPYQGPALQPVFSARFGRLELGLAPAGRWHQITATSPDGREAQVRVGQWRLGGRALWSHQLADGWSSWFVGVEGAGSGGGARVADLVVAEGSGVIEVGPTLGLRTSLSDKVDLAGRLRWPVSLSQTGTSHGPGGAVAIEWRL